MDAVEESLQKEQRKKYSHGFDLLAAMGFDGRGLGRKRDGIAEPLQLNAIRKARAGVDHRAAAPTPVVQNDPLVTNQTPDERFTAMDDSSSEPEFIIDIDPPPIKRRQYGCADGETMIRDLTGGAFEARDLEARRQREDSRRSDKDTERDRIELRLKRVESELSEVEQQLQGAQQLSRRIDSILPLAPIGLEGLKAIRQKLSSFIEDSLEHFVNHSVDVVRCIFLLGNWEWVDPEAVEELLRWQDLVGPHNAWQVPMEDAILSSLQRWVREESDRGEEGQEEDQGKMGCLGLPSVVYDLVAHLEATRALSPEDLVSLMGDCAFTRMREGVINSFTGDYAAAADLYEAVRDSIPHSIGVGHETGRWVLLSILEFFRLEMGKESDIVGAGVERSPGP